MNGEEGDEREGSSLLLVHEDDGGGVAGQVWGSGQSGMGAGAKGDQAAWANSAARATSMGWVIRAVRNSMLDLPWHRAVCSIEGSTAWDSEPAADRVPLHIFRMITRNRSSRKGDIPH